MYMELPCHVAGIAAYVYGIAAYVAGIAAYVAGIAAYVYGIAAHVAGIAVHVARIAVRSSACCSDHREGGWGVEKGAMGNVVPIFERRGGASGASRPRACGCFGGFAPRSMRRIMLGASVGAPNRCAVETSSDGCGVGQSSPLRPSVCACVCVCACGGGGV